MRIATLSKFKIAAMIGLLVICAIPSRAADVQPIRWVVADGEEVDKAKAIQIYDAACAWIEDHLTTSRTPVQPKLIIHIGEACPDDELADACFSPATAELYIRRWEDSSASAVANATLIAGLIQLMDRDQMRRTVARFLEQDASTLITARNNNAASDAEPN